MSWLHVAILCLATWFAVVQRADWPALVLALAVVLSALALFNRALGAGPLRRASSWSAALFGIPRFYLLFALPNVVEAARFHFWPTVAPGALKPCILAVRVPGASQTALSIFAHGVTMSPSEQVVAIDTREPRLFVHVMHAPDPEAHRARLEEAFNRYLRSGV